MQSTIHYGKQQITLYRSYARPLTGITPIPESAFVGRGNQLFAASVAVQVNGEHFLPAYTEGDNREVVATDTMKNFVLREALTCAGATLEGLLAHLGERFLATYAQMDDLELSARELPFAPVSVPQGEGFAASDVLFSQSYGPTAFAKLHLLRGTDGQGQISTLQSGISGLQLIKLTGSSFANFARDGYTTLEERPDRALFTFLDLSWEYADPQQAVGSEYAHYIPAEQVRDVAQVVFHEFVSLSIQHLVYEMGQRILARFPQMAAISFAGQNRTWDTAAVSAEDPKIKAYTDPRPGHGQIGLRLVR